MWHIVGIAISVGRKRFKAATNRTVTNCLLLVSVSVETAICAVVATLLSIIINPHDCQTARFMLATIITYVCAVGTFLLIL